MQLLRQHLTMQNNGQNKEQTAAANVFSLLITGEWERKSEQVGHEATSAAERPIHLCPDGYQHFEERVRTEEEDQAGRVRQHVQQRRASRVRRRRILWLHARFAAR